MSAESAALVRSWAVGRYTCTLTAPRPKAGKSLHVAIEWAPQVPHKLTPNEFEQYRRGRDEALAALGLRTLVVDL